MLPKPRIQPEIESKDPPASPVSVGTRLRLAGSPGRRAAIQGAFTAHIRELAEGADDSRVERSFEAFQQALEITLGRELRRRGLWATPPRFLGIEGGDRWTRRQIAELSTDAYLYLLERLRALHQHLRSTGDIDALVTLNIRHFVHERQRRCDPLGSRVYGIAREALSQLVAAGTLTVLEGNPKLDNSTRFGAARRGDGPEPSTGEIEDYARTLVDALLPDLVTGWGKRRQAVVRRMAERLSEGSRAGELPGFAFKDLLHGMKTATRARWRAAWELDRGDVGLEGDSTESAADLGDLPPRIPTVQPDASFEQQQSWQALIDCVSEGVEAEDLGSRSQIHLANLWHFLRTSSEQAETTPSKRRIAELLGIPRSTLPALYSRLRRFTDRCLDTAPAPEEEP